MITFKQTLITAMLTATLVATGCSTMHGAKMNAQQITSSIVRGQTTEAQVRALLGEPVAVNYTSNSGIKRLTFHHDNNSQIQKNLAGAGGAILGGVLGHQVGGGIGKELATIFGVGVGSALGDNAVTARKFEQVLTVDIDTRTGRVVDYNYSEAGNRSQSWRIGQGVGSL